MVELPQPDQQEPIFVPSSDREPRDWKPFIIGLALVVVVVAALVFFSRPARNTGAPPNPYISKIAIGNVAMSKEASFLGSEVTYVDAAITNNGDRTVLGVTVQAVFRNSLSQVVGDEKTPARVLAPNPLAGYPDLVSMAKAPIEPGKSRNVRITFEHISTDWNQSTPELIVADVQLK